MVRRAPRSTRKAPRFPYTTLFRPGLDSDPSVAVVTLATAHPAKFRDAVERATGVRPPLPARLGNLFDRAERYQRLAGDYDAVKAPILAPAARGRSASPPHPPRPSAGGLWAYPPPRPTPTRPPPPPSRPPPPPPP